MPKDTNKTRTFNIGKTSVTLSKSVKKSGPKTNEVQKGIYIKKKDGSTYQREKTKTAGLKGVFDKKKTVVKRSPAGTSKDDFTVSTRTRKAGFLPRVKKTEYDNLMQEKSSKTNLFYKLGTKRERAKLKNDVRGEGERTKVKNCLKGCSANPLNK